MKEQRPFRRQRNITYAGESMLLCPLVDASKAERKVSCLKYEPIRVLIIISTCMIKASF